MEENPYYELIKGVKTIQGDPDAAFRLGLVRKTAPLTVAVGENLCDEEIKGACGGYALKKGDSVLMACIDGDDGYIIIGKVEKL